MHKMKNGENVNTHACTNAGTHTCMYTCMHTCLATHTPTPTHTHTHPHTHNSSFLFTVIFLWLLCCLTYVMVYHFLFVLYTNAPDSVSMIKNCYFFFFSITQFWSTVIKTDTFICPQKLKRGLRNTPRISSRNSRRTLRHRKLELVAEGTRRRGWTERKEMFAFSVSSNPTPSVQLNCTDATPAFSLAPASIVFILSRNRNSGTGYPDVNVRFPFVREIWIMQGFLCGLCPHGGVQWLSLFRFCFEWCKTSVNWGTMHLLSVLFM